MIGLRRTTSLAVISAAILTLPSWAQSAQEDFQQGVELLDRGQTEQALAAFQRVLAQDPSHEEAYELWQATDNRIWLQMLVEEGEFELVAKRLMSLAAMGRKARQDNPDAIRGMLADLNTEDVSKRMTTVRQLAADYGEYAVPQMLHGLADEANGDRRVIFMHALTQMGSDVVPPLIEALDTDAAFLRRNVALTLGYIADPRANGVLAMLATSDEDEGVRSAASSALERTGGSMDALAQLLAEGAAYHSEEYSVLRPYQYSDVVWSWAEGGLAFTEVPRLLYPGELAKKAYYRALAASPGSIEALAGIARVSIAQRERLAQWEEAGQDVGDWPARLEVDELAVRIAGADALDLALGWALEQDDQAAASGLCRALGRVASEATPNLTRALSASRSGAVGGEAAIALGSISCSTGAPASPAVVASLARSVATEISQIVAIIDGNDDRRHALASALEGRGLTVNAWPRGARGLVSLRSIPGVDAILIAESLPDLTFHQVVTEVAADPRTAQTPVLVIAEDAEAAADMYGASTAGAISSAADVEAVEAAMSEGLSGDRARADNLAARSAEALLQLASAGTDISASADVLAGTLASRPDAVALPAMLALARAGGAGQVSALAAVLTDGERSDAARLAAAEALSGIFGRGAATDQGIVQSLHEIAVSDASFGIRAAAASALGRLSVSGEMRAELMRAVRADISQ